VQTVLDSKVTSPVPRQIRLQDEARWKPVRQFELKGILALASWTSIDVKFENLRRKFDKHVSRLARYMLLAGTSLDRLQAYLVVKLCFFRALKSQ